jgi:dCMP deaminase
LEIYRENVRKMKFSLEMADGSTLEFNIPDPPAVTVEIEREETSDYQEVRFNPWDLNPVVRDLIAQAVELKFKVSWTNPLSLYDSPPLFTMIEVPADARPSKSEWGLLVAEAVATRGECTRRKVGAIVVNKRGRIVGAGYNGAPARKKSCLDGACPRATSGVEPGSSYDTGPGVCIAIHAEANAIIDAGREGYKGELFVSTLICDGCLRLAKAAGITWVHCRTSHGTVDSIPIR